MFSWSAGFCMEAEVPGQRSPEELVTNTLMLELGTLLKQADRLHQERGTDARRHRSSVDYSWLATPHQKPLYEPSPGELLELHGLCTKIRPSQCGPVILRSLQAQEAGGGVRARRPRGATHPAHDSVGLCGRGGAEQGRRGAGGGQLGEAAQQEPVLRHPPLPLPGRSLGGGHARASREARLWHGEDDDGGGPHFSVGGEDPACEEHV